MNERETKLTNPKSFGLIFPDGTSSEDWLLLHREGKNPVSSRPGNFLDLQKAYQELAPLNSSTMTGAAFLTDERENIIMVYTACGDKTGLDDPFVEEGQLLDLLKNYDFNSFVYIHNQLGANQDDLPQIKKGNSKHLEWLAQSAFSATRNLWKNCTISLYSAVTYGDKVDYAWQAYQVKSWISAFPDDYYPPLLNSLDSPKKNLILENIPIHLLRS